MRERTIVWVGSSLDDLRAMPTAVRRLMGAALFWAQTSIGAHDKGRRPVLHPAATRMRGNLSEVVEIREDFDGGTYRAMYTASLGETIYVLHAFQKKSKRGIETPARDLDLIHTRLRSARAGENSKGRAKL